MKPYAERLHRVAIATRQSPTPDPLLRMGISYILDQTDWWVPADGTPVALIEMSHRYKRNVHAFLLRRAPQIEFTYSLQMLGLGSALGGEAAQDAFENVMDEHDREVARIGAKQWLRERPLLRELVYQCEVATYDGPVD